MVKSKIIILFFLLPILLLAGGIKNEAELIIKNSVKTDKIVFEKFKIDSKLKSDIELKAGQKFFSDSVYKWNIYKNDSLSAIALLDNVYGKVQLITFLVIYDLNGNIINAKIVKYRESHGGQVQSETWLEQFNNKSAVSGFKVGTDIDGISGATISANSVSKGIYKLSLLAERITNDEN